MSKERRPQCVANAQGDKEPTKRASATRNCSTVPGGFLCWHEFHFDTFDEDVFCIKCGERSS